ncbi:VanZ family protein [Clostridium tagluense]|uniref:VanZ family protein n=1 Tax=Clostridium tagluense TaxID=360422 RepID=UPI001CF5586A|nr:VanZ family protein [Clostridium tagluense]MCB2310428.1 VanZ family protein [Clostridium tagluense]MCB2315406.1 VanZ family protein [Clostridium tagluense]MCB2320259.1 VanZ family protein [Clostridium tagluense]MCB2325148.1 VanZ family protein [Clostridium tagluense]MCB2330000.1 VanZ family protein [Clostridium tagluense]
MGTMLDFKALFIISLPILILVRVVLILKNRSKGQFSIKREIVLNLFFVYILCNIGITLFPLFINWTGQEGNVSINVVPVFNTIKDISRASQQPEMKDFMIKFWIKNILGNMLLLFPFGLLLPILWKKFGNMKKTLLYSFLFTLGIEIIQLLSYYVGNIGRSFDIDDIILNTFGAWIGYMFYKKIILKLINKQFLNGIHRNVDYSK